MPHAVCGRGHALVTLQRDELSGAISSAADCRRYSSGCALLTGTRRRLPLGCTYGNARSAGYWGIHFGWQRGTFTNSCAGCCIMLREEKSPQFGCELISTHAELTGRCRMIRPYALPCDLTLNVAFPPPDGTNINVKARWLGCDWTRKVFCAALVRSFSFLGSDLNGRSRRDGPKQRHGYLRPYGSIPRAHRRLGVHEKRERPLPGNKSTFPGSAVPGGRLVARPQPRSTGCAG